MNPASAFYSTQHQKATLNQRLTYPSDRPRSSIGWSGLLQPLLLLALPVNYRMIVNYLSPLPPYRFSLSS